MSRARTKGEKKRDLAAEAFAEGMRLVQANPALRAVEFGICRSERCTLAPRDGLVVVDSDGDLHLHPDRIAEPALWAWSIAHAVLHLGFGHVPAVKGDRTQPDRYDLAARCVVVNRFLLGFTIGRTPESLPGSYPDGDEERLAARWRRDGLPAAYEHCGTAGAEPDQVLLPWHGWHVQPPDHQLAFATALTRTVSEPTGGRPPRLHGRPADQRAPGVARAELARLLLPFLDGARGNPVRRHAPNGPGRTGRPLSHPGRRHRSCP